MISITAPDFDLNGQAVFIPDPQSDLHGGSRRASRTATLDGGCSITDQGFSHGDRTLEVSKTGVAETLYSTLWYMFRTYSLVRVSLDEGCFLGAISDCRMKQGELRMRILIKESI